MSFLLESLSVEDNPKHCGRCLYGALVLCTAPPEIRNDAPFKTTNSTRRNIDFWNTLYRFLVTPRSDTQVEGLLARLSQCSCQMGDRSITAYHITGQKTESWTIERLWILKHAPPLLKPKYTTARIAFVINVFCMLYRGMGDTGVRSVKSIAKGGVELWPTSPADLVPFGADELVRSLMQWYRFIPDTIIYQLTAKILHVCQHILLPSLGKFKFCNAIADSTKGMVDFTMVEFPAILDTSPTTPGILIRVAAAITRWTYHTEAFIEFFTTIFRDISVESWMLLFLGCETKLVQIFSILLYISSDPTTPPHRTESDLIKQLPSWCSSLFRWFHMHLYFPKRPDIPLYPACVEHDEMTFPHPEAATDRSTYLYFTIQTLRKQTRCCAIQCPNSMQSAGKNFQRCSRCQLVSYCGRECQTRSWSDEHYPHKRVCTILRRLVASAGNLALFDMIPNVRLMLYGVVPYMNDKWLAAGISSDDLECVYQWGMKMGSGQGDRPDGTLWNEGYEDYDKVIEMLSARGPKREFSALSTWCSREAD